MARDAGAARQAPALLVSAPASGQAKTTVTAGLARYFRRQGLRPRVFKVGPDFLDPMILERASGAPVYQLDLWMVGPAECQRLLYEAASEADLILVEGVMGLFDGQPSSADIATHFGLPVLAVIDAGAMAQTFGALAHGLAHYRDDIRLSGVIANRVAGAGHSAMLAQSMPAGIDYLGYLPPDESIGLPDRHLGLVQAAEIADLNRRLDAAADAIEEAAQWKMPHAVRFDPPQHEDAQPRYLEDTRIGVARDAAFSFIYPANVDLLRDMGAEVVFFSILEDDTLPAVDGLWLPGGYPELHLDRLGGNASMKAAIRSHHEHGKPILAECGGMLYALDSLTTTDGQRTEMAGLMPGHAVMQRRLTSLGLQSVELPSGALRGHTFHHSRLESDMEPCERGRCPLGGPTSEAVYQVGSLVASYVHFYFPSNPAACAALFRAEAGA
ncbi:MAG TPA: cobyrinate a,c-diamide synthase [Burkholderiales bacterium]|nr:cobyrinate a,c-diamide synthase [Burkholderiales bacterium]